ncbi:MAG: ABC transporter permease [Rhodothermales bacterium]
MSPFNLDTAIATWRQFVCAEQAISEEDADELEGHLRDHFDELVEEGRRPEAAFEQAVEQLGGFALLERDYKDVYWRKVRNENRLFATIRSRLAIFQNYFRVSLRHMRRQPGYTLINVSGLAIGLAGCLFISMYVWNEISYDRFHTQADNIYRLVQETDNGSSASSAGAHAALVRQSIPGVAATVRIIPWERTITVTTPQSTEQSVFSEPAFVYADPTFFDVFSFQLIAGNQATALSEPGHVVITETIAQKYFGQADPLGQVILMYDGYSDPNQIPLTVTGVLADIPAQSHLPLTVVASSSTIEHQYGPLNKLDWPGLYTYVHMPGAMNITQAAQSATNALANQLPNESITLHLQPLKQIYLHPQMRGEVGPRGSSRIVYGLTGMALIVLLLACTNFTNLAIARATSRIRELGVRRAMGAHRTQIATQFLTDSFILTGIAVCIAAGLIWGGKSLLLPNIDASLFLNWGLGVLFVFVGLVVLTGLLAGAYPAFMAAREQPTQTLRGLPSRKATKLRSTLIVFQFTSCIILMAGAFVVHQQLGYVRSIGLGFEQEHVLTIRANKGRRSFEVLRETIAAQPGVLAVSAVNGLPGLQEVRTGMVVQPDENRDSSVPVQTQGVGPDFFKTLNIALAAGRLPDFNQAHSSAIIDSPLPHNRLLLINETAAASLGWHPEEAIEQPLRITEPGNEANNPGITGIIAGVVKDFHHSSVRTPITASVYYSAQSIDVPGLYVISHLLVKVAPGNTEQQLDKIKSAWHKVLPDYPFEASFLDQQIQAQYKMDVQLGRVIGFFAGLAILIASLGLFGLASFMAQRRTKEVGIRKVLGASEGNMLLLLSGNFLKLVGISFIIATPVAYIALRKWLQEFAYRIDLSPLVFLLIGLLVLIIALVAVSFQTIRTARGNPVDALRYE